VRQDTLRLALLQHVRKCGLDSYGKYPGVFAAGIRNGVGPLFDKARDGLHNNLVPDYSPARADGLNVYRQQR
jgi:hypothetical protein